MSVNSDEPSKQFLNVKHQQVKGIVRARGPHHVNAWNRDATITDVS